MYTEFIFVSVEFASKISRSGLVVKFVLAMHEPRVRFTAATFVLSFVDPNATRHCFIVLPGSVRLGKGHLVVDFDRSLG